MVHKRRWVVWGVGAVLVATGGALVARLKSNAEGPATDTTCHDSFRSGSATVLVPRQFIYLEISEEQWPQLREMLKGFASEHDWSFRDASVDVPNELASINFSLCSEDSLRIVVSVNHWRGRSYGNSVNGVPVLLYGQVPADVWRPVAREVYRKLDAQWPGRVRFATDEGGTTNELPAHLR